MGLGCPDSRPFGGEAEGRCSGRQHETILPDTQGTDSRVLTGEPAPGAACAESNRPRQVYSVIRNSLSPGLSSSYISFRAANADRLPLCMAFR